MKRRIRTKMMISVAVIVTLALLTSGVSAYVYFYDVLKKQVMSDERDKTSRTAGQLRYVQEDIRQLAQYILVDADIQARINAVYSSDDYERLSALDSLRTKLNQYLLLKNWIESIVLVDKNAQAVSTNLLSNAYHTETLKESWYVRHQERGVHAGFSEVHRIARPSESVPVISYLINFNPQLDPESRLHQLIIHVNADYIANSLPADKQGYDAYYLLGPDNQILAGSDSNPDVAELPLDRLSGQEPVYQDEQGRQIVTINATMGDWKLVTVMAKVQMQRQINSILILFMVIILVTIVVILIALTSLVTNITRPISKLTHAMKEASIGRLNATVDIRSGDEIELLGEGFNRMLHDLKSYIDQSVEDGKLRQKLQYDLLLSQVNPHFIYNTLNTVIYMAQRDGNRDIAKMVDSFIRLLQSAVLVEQNGHHCTLAEEIASVEHYLIIQNYRYPDRFAVNWQVDEQWRSVRIPRTIIQPLVENALFHGLMPNAEEQGTIRIRIGDSGGFLCIEVEDDGVGMDQALIDGFEQDVNGQNAPEQAGSASRRSIGLANVRDRLQSICGPAASLRIRRLAPGGTCVKLSIPLPNLAG